MMTTTNDTKRKAWIADMVAHLRCYNATESPVTDAGEAYDLLKTDYRAEAPSRAEFESAANEALALYFRAEAATRKAMGRYFRR